MVIEAKGGQEVESKKFYEKCLGQKISESTWNRDKALMRLNNLSINKENLSLYARLKVQSKKFSLPIQHTIKYFLLVSINTQARGIDIYFKLLEICPIKPHRTTIYRWFPGGYQLEKIYSKDEVAEILLRCFIYKLRIEKSGTRTQAYRSYQISA